MKFFLWITASLSILLSLYYLNLYDIRSASEGLIFTNRDSLPATAIILVPGTGRNYPGARINYLFTGRVIGASELYATGRYPLMLLSGLNDGAAYDEANDLKNALKKYGIPDSVFVLDQRSEDTFATLLWYHKHYPGRKVIFVSQRLHLERMIWLARQLHIDCAGYEAAGWPGGVQRWFYIRERGARIKARVEIIIYKLTGIVIH